MPHSITRSESVYKILNPKGDPFKYNPENQSQLETIGLVLWMTEGDATQLSLANGNPSIITTYLQFLREVCGLHEEKIKAVIHCHDTLNYEQCREYWSSITKIPPHHFNKPFIKKDTGGTRKYPYGIIRIATTNRKLLNIFKERLQSLGLFR